MNTGPLTIASGLFIEKNKTKNEEVSVVPNVNPIFLDRPINPETTLTSFFGAEFITEVPLETVKIVKAPADKATKGTMIMSSRSIVKARRKIKKLSKNAPNDANFRISIFSAKIPAMGPIMAIATGGTIMRSPVWDPEKSKTSW